MTPLGKALWEAGLALRETEFSARLRTWRSTPQNGRLTPNDLLGWELSFDPALQRTMAAVWSLELLGRPATKESAEWVLWVAGALGAMQRIASKCWTGVPTEIRRAFFDVDDVIAPGAESYLVNLRVDESSASPLSFGGLDARPVRQALARVYAEVEAMPSASGARLAARILSRRPELMQPLIQLRARLGRGLLLGQAGDTLQRAFARTRVIVADAYKTNAELAGLVGSLRNHNRLVTRVFWVLLGLAEQAEPAVVTETVGAVSDRIVEGERHLNLTVQDPRAALLRPTHPVLVDMSSPLDGLYWLYSHTFTMVENDLGLVALGDPVADG